MIQFIEVRSGLGAGKQGADAGVSLLSKLHKKRYPNAPTLSLTPQVFDAPKDYRHLKNACALLPFYQYAVQQITHAINQHNQTPIAITGDHSCAIATTAGFKNAYPNARVGLVWIDAHADLHTAYTTPSGNIHGMPVGAATNLDNKTQISELGTPSDEESHIWQAFKNLSQVNNIDISDVFFLGLRSFEAPEAHLLDKHNIFHYSALEHRRAGFAQVLKSLATQLEKFDTVYISFDIDSLDDRLVHATGTPEPDGYTVDEMAQIFDVLLSKDNIGMFEITEFNPTLDDDEQKYQHIYQLFNQVCDTLSQKHLNSTTQEAKCA